MTDPSDFEDRLDVHGEVLHGEYRVLTIESSSVPNALAALLLHIRDVSGVTPHIYFEWTEGNPVTAVPAVPAVRLRRGGAGDPRGAPPRGAGPCAAPARACRMMEG